MRCYKRKSINECDGGSIGAGMMACLSNTGGIGNPVPAQISASGAADQTSPSCIGSGDKFGCGNDLSFIKKRKYKIKKKSKSK